jgi:hypothetical protein
MISISLATSALKENSSLDYYDSLNAKIFLTSISDCTSESMSNPSNLGRSLLALASLREISFSSSVIAMTLMDSNMVLEGRVRLTMEEENLKSY